MEYHLTDFVKTIGVLHTFCHFFFFYHCHGPILPYLTQVLLQHIQYLGKPTLAKMTEDEEQLLLIQFFSSWMFNLILNYFTTTRAKGSFLG